MLIVSAESQNDYKSYKEYIRYTDKKKAHYVSAKITSILVLLCSVALIIAFSLMGGNVFLYMVLFIDILCAMASVFLHFIAPKIEFNKLQKNFTLPQTFNFYDSRLELIVHSDKNILSRIPYVKILKVIDSPTAFYLYVAKDKALILNKINLKTHETEKLRNLFKQKGITVIK